MRAITLVAMMALVSVAGCADAPAEPVDEDFIPEGAGEDLQATEDTGIIRGVVVNEAIVPIEGVTVCVDGQEMCEDTNEDGFFGFDGLAGGVYFLTAEKPGWIRMQANAPVEPGVASPSAIRIQMVADPVTMPSITELKFDGLITCSFSLLAVGFAACNTVAGQTGDKFIEQYDAGSVGGAEPTWAQSEMVWKSTQALGSRMSVQYSAPGDGALLDNYARGEGESPLVIMADREAMDVYNVPTGNTLMIRVFNSGVEGTDVGRDYGDPTDGDDCVERPALGGCTTGLGATLDQKFEIYTHVFHNWTPPEYQYSKDGLPEP